MLQEINQVDINSKMGKYLPSIDNEIYHNDTYFLSSSQVKKAVKNPFIFKDAIIDGNAKPLNRSMDCALDWGTLVHTMLLEPHLVDEEIAIMDTEGLDFRRKADKEYKANFLAENKGKLVVSRKAFNNACKAVENVMSYGPSKELIEAKGLAELSGYCVHPFYKQPIRIRPDKLIPDFKGRRVIVDVKTTQFIDMNDFKYKAVLSLGYDVSAGMYVHADKVISGKDVDDFYWLCVQNTAPYAVAVYRVSEETMNTGTQKYNNAMTNIKDAYSIGENLTFQSEIEEL